MQIACVEAPDPGVARLLAAHHAHMRDLSPEESCHVMTDSALRASGARIFVLRDSQGASVAVGALKPLDAEMVELKSMHVAADRRGAGLGRCLLDHLLQAARTSGATSAWLETGTTPAFAAARRLYTAAGFTPCPPFGPYHPHPMSLFMTREL
ncbi:hypothetical protein AVJ23_21590 [Pseudoponticoccus marisrubri]|uniref:N-acetyltransferase domain-containing protein n=1 Tax=Pseudoponticoccus marisrubri TaxID=1685382 RepID=A0A0W7WDE7_9RHOB|nr:hypothetical protein AVJ23_21590 [Pseudoponticoccus marisrubri]